MALTPPEMEPQVYQSFQPDGYDGTDDLLAMVRICAHFYANYGWLQDGELIHNAGALADIPGVLVHGRQDLSCPVETAYELATELSVCDRSGHRSSPAKREYISNALGRLAH
ncbi:hypothetical protein NOVA_02445 [Nocardia nova]|nr:hypothetical protein [Nocardia nova]MBV7701620.1 hypothetical protein [Nocardia nova]